MALNVPRELPPPSIPAFDAHRILSYLRTFSSRLTDWTHKVAAAFTSMILAQTDLAPTPNGAATTFTVPFEIAKDQNGRPQALLCADLQANIVTPVPWTATDPPPAGLWTLHEDTSGQTVLLGTAPLTVAFFAFLVSR